MFVGEIDETLETIRAVRSRLPCFALTNTTPSHQAVWSAAFPGVVAVFERFFSSPELGVRKPEREAFELVSREVGVSPSNILFFDDTLEHVEGTRGGAARGPCPKPHGCPKDTAGYRRTEPLLGYVSGTVV